MNKTNSKLHIVGPIVLGCICAAIFNWYHFKPGKAATQLHFEQWLSSYEARIDESELSEIPKISVELVSDPNSLNFSVRSEDTQDKHDQMLRLLQLTREADLFSLDNSASSSDFKLTLKIGSKTFVSSLLNDDIISNVPAENLFQLLQIYVAQETAKPKLMETESASN